MKGLMLFSKGFEESEALITVDLLRRANIQIDLVSLDKELNVYSSHNISINCEMKISQVNLKDYDFLVIPGGSAVFNTLINSFTVKSIVDYFINQHLLIAAICAAPMILGKYKYLKGKDYVCFPGCESDEFEANLVNRNVALVDNIITAKAAGVTFEFAYEIIKYLKDEEAAKRVINSVYYQFTTKNN